MLPRMAAAPPSRTRAKKPRGPWLDLLHVLWIQPLFAIPFALFFGTLSGASRRDYLEGYRVSLCFSYAVGLAIWAVSHLLVPHLDLPERSTRSTWIYSSIYTGASILGAFGGACIVHFYVVPGMLGSARSVVTMAMFTLLFAALAMGIALAVAFYQKAIAHVKSEEELHLARRIQRSFLLSQFPTMPRLEVHAVNVSSKEVSGDFYDVVQAGERAFLLAIADVAGKGVPAALLSSMLQASLRTQAGAQPSVAAILKNINTLVYRSTAVNQFATFFLARVEEDTLRLTFSNAGHNFPLVFRKNGVRKTLERGGTVVGILESAEFEEEALELVPGDRVILYTDGINEAANEQSELYGEERLCTLVAGLPAELTAREITECILEGVRKFLDGVEPGDDMTVMVLRVLEVDPAGVAPGGAPN